MESFVLKGLIVMAFLWAYTSAGNFYQDCNIIFGGGHVQISRDGKSLSLSLDKQSGSGVVSKKSYLFGRFDMQINLIPNNSAGTVTTFYLRSQGEKQDEIDFEFLGNNSGHPYTLHTNIYTHGIGNREQQFRLQWINPTVKFHTYTILWDSQRIILKVDNTPIRAFNNYATYKVPFPTRQYMNMYATFWNADDWATQGGRVKTDWSKAPFKAYYKNLNITKLALPTPILNPKEKKKLKSFQRNYMIYNYCDDTKRFPEGLPEECKHPMF